MKTIENVITFSEPFTYPTSDEEDQVKERYDTLRDCWRMILNDICTHASPGFCAEAWRIALGIDDWCDHSMDARASKYGRTKQALSLAAKDRREMLGLPKNHFNLKSQTYKYTNQTHIKK
jgi:hypothetical protein